MRFSRTFSRMTKWGAVCAVIAVVPCVCAQTPGIQDGTEEKVSLNLNNAEITSVIRAVGKISGRNFVIDPRVKGNLTLVTDRQIPREMTYSLLLSALRLQGYTVIENEGVTKVVPEADAKLHSVLVRKRGGAVRGDQIVTEIIPIRHESAAQMIQVLRPLVSPNNVITAYPGNNSIVITDYAENVERLRRVVDSLDTPQGNALLVPLSNASAMDVAATLTRLYAGSEQGTADPSQRIVIIADARSNAVLIRSDNVAQKQAVRNMAMQMDTEGTTGNIRVVYLKNADAARVAETLRAAFSSSPPLAVNDRSTATSNTSAFANDSMSSMSASSAGGAVSPGGSAARSGAGAANPPANVFADVANNALVITASDAVYNNIRGVIDDLDRRPAQIFVEALIAEVSSERAAEIGIQWQAGNFPNDGSTSVFAGTNFGDKGQGQNILGVAANPLSAAAGLNFIVGSGPVKIAGQEIFNLNLLARLLESDSEVNILSTPSLITVDNEEAKIVIGKNLPFTTGQYSTTGGNNTVTPFQTIERRDVGLMLKVKAQITEGGAIRMRIYQEASNVLDNTASGPITSTRTLESTVISDDGSIIALGGLIEDSYTGSESKVPYLSDVPLIGNAFRYDNRKRTKTNLLIFLHPKILRTAKDTRDVSHDRYDYVIGRQQATGRSRTLADGRMPDSVPQLPPLAAPPQPQPLLPAATEPGVSLQP